MEVSRCPIMENRNSIQEVSVGNSYICVVSGDVRTGFKLINTLQPQIPCLPRTGEQGPAIWSGLFVLVGTLVFMIKRLFVKPKTS